ncbi:MAG: NAD(P)/FAD-dependent oxidoreductase [Sulfolobales archaeon]
MRCRYIIVGGGVVGLSTALHLAILTNEGSEICVLEKDFVGYGNSGRNGGRYRVHFGAEENLRFAIEAIKYLKSIDKLIDYNPLITTTGYLWLIFDEEAYKNMRKHAENFRRYGVPLKEFSAEETFRRYFFLKPRKDLIASFLGPQDGSFHPDSIVYGLRRSCERRGVRIFERTYVSNVIIKDSRVIGVETIPKGFFQGDNIILAVNEDLKYFSDKLGLGIPIEPLRKEIMVTEPFRYTIDVFVIDGQLKMYFSQTLKGEIIGSVKTGREARGLVERENTILWLRYFARALRIALRGSESIRIMRLWSGFYDMTPDSSHVIGRSRDWPEGLYVAGGFSGHGFMFGPYTGKVLAEYVVTGKMPEIAEPFTPERFKTGRLIHETFVIG